MAREHYHYINQTSVYEVKDVDDAEDFKITLKCMQNIGFTQLEIDQILNIVVAILQMGNMGFEVVPKQGYGDLTYVAQDSKYILETISILLQLPSQAIEKALTTKV